MKSDELSERERKKQKAKWKAASRGYRERKKMEQAMLELTPPILVSIEVDEQETEGSEA